SPGETYVEEASLANAEDVTDVLSTTYRYGADAELDRYVPRRLAELFCSARDCVVTRNYSLLEPGIFDRKFYARGVGVFLEVHLTGAGSVRRPARRRGVRPVTLALLLLAAPAVDASSIPPDGTDPACAQETCRYAGRPLIAALEDLRARGLNLVFSSDLVRPD